MMPSKRRALKKSKTVDALIDKLEMTKASIRAKVGLMKMYVIESGVLLMNMKIRECILHV